MTAEITAMAGVWNVEVSMAPSSDPGIQRKREDAGRAFAKAVQRALYETELPEGFEIAVLTRQRRFTKNVRPRVLP